MAGKEPKRARTELLLSPKSAHHHEEANGGHERSPGQPRRPKKTPAGPKTKTCTIYTLQPINKKLLNKKFDS